MMYVIHLAVILISLFYTSKAYDKVKHSRILELLKRGMCPSRARYLFESF